MKAPKVRSLDELGPRARAAAIQVSREAGWVYWPFTFTKYRIVGDKAILIEEERTHAAQ